MDPPWTSCIDKYFISNVEYGYFPERMELYMRQMQAILLNSNIPYNILEALDMIFLDAITKIEIPRILLLDCFVKE